MIENSDKIDYVKRILKDVKINSSGINRDGGKFFLAKELCYNTIYHKAFLSLFCGACWYEIAKPKAESYEQFNDIDKNLMNYLEVISEFSEEFEGIKKGFFGIVSSKTLERFKGFLNEDEIENKLFSAYAFYYMAKLTVMKGMSKIGSPKLNRPITNQDCGILTPLNHQAIKRLNYAHLTNFDFEKCFTKFEKHYKNAKFNNVKPHEVLVFADKPYIKQKIYDFPLEKHEKLAELLGKTDFSFMLTCRDDKYNRELFDKYGEREIYYKILKTRYSGNSKSKKNKGVNELLITNFSTDKLRKLKNGIEKMVIEKKRKPKPSYFSKYKS